MQCGWIPQTDVILKYRCWAQRILRVWFTCMKFQNRQKLLEGEVWGWQNSLQRGLREFLSLCKWSIIYTLTEQWVSWWTHLSKHWFVHSRWLHFMLCKFHLKTVNKNNSKLYLGSLIMRAGIVDHFQVWIHLTYYYCDSQPFAVGSRS